jgi:hypothetical protein
VKSLSIIDMALFRAISRQQKITQENKEMRLLKTRCRMVIGAFSISIIVAACGSGDGVPDSPGSGLQGDDTSTTLQADVAGSKKDAKKNTEIFSTPNDFPKVNCVRASKLAKESKTSVIGIELGMGLDDALLLLRCHGGEIGHYAYLTSSLRIRNGERFLDKQGLSFVRSRRISSCDDIALKQGNPSVWNTKCLTKGVSDLDVTESIEILTPGAPGAQKVISVMRRQNFASGDQPASEDIRRALIAKYGEPTFSSGFSSSFTLAWARDAKGNPPHNQSSCRIDPSNSTGSYSSNCGRSIGAIVRGVMGHETLAASVTVMAVDQSLAVSVGQETELWVNNRMAEIGRKEAAEARSADSIKF